MPFCGPCVPSDNVILLSASDLGQKVIQKQGLTSIASAAPGCPLAVGVTRAAEGSVCPSALVMTSCHSDGH